MAGISKSDPHRKPNYFPWNEDDFSGNIKVRFMTPAQRWMYRTLLCSAFFESTRPHLPDDDSVLWMIAGCESQEQWNENKEPVRAMFFQIRDGRRKLLGHPRLVSDWNALVKTRLDWIEKSRKGGAASAQAKVEQRSTTG